MKRSATLFMLGTAAVLATALPAAAGTLRGAGPEARAMLAMGPNPGGRLGEDMPFEGDDVIRRAPAATREREGGKVPGEKPARAEQAAPCPERGDGQRPDCPAPAAQEPTPKR